MKAVIAENLMKTYNKGSVQALDGLSLDVEEGTVLGVLGPNGAGKTTTVRILATLLSPDSGRANVAGIDVLKHPDEVRKIIGLSGQYAAVDETLTGWDNLIMFGRLYHLSAKDAKDRAIELLEQFSLSDAAKRPIRTYSGGMRRRLDLAASLIIRPKVLFLDEPTTGLDPRGRQDMWGVIDDLVKGGVTLLLTTQYLEEADHLADEIAVIDHGKVIARGTSDSLKKQVGGERLEIVVENENVQATKEIVAKVSGSAVNVDEGLRQISAPVTTGSKALIEAAKMLDEAGIHPLDIGLKRPSLDDVFLSLTGHVAEEKIAEVSAKVTELQVAVTAATQKVEAATVAQISAKAAAESAAQAAATKAAEVLTARNEATAKTQAATKAAADASLAAKVAAAAVAAAAEVPSKAVIATKPSTSTNKNSAKATVTGLKPGQKVKVTVNVKGK